MDARTQRRLSSLAEERGARGFTFDDLAAVAVEAGVDARQVATWLREGRESGLLADLGQETLSDGTVIGPQRFALAAAVEQPRSGSHACGNGESNGEASHAQRYAEVVRYR